MRPRPSGTPYLDPGSLDDGPGIAGLLAPRTVAKPAPPPPTINGGHEWPFRACRIERLKRIYADLSMQPDALEEALGKNDAAIHRRDVPRVRW